MICHETIYNFIFNPEFKSLKLWQELPRGHAKRRKWHGRSGKVERIPSRVSIHDRPEEIEDRSEFGHWEGDSVIGRGKHHGIHTEVERKTRYLKARLLPHLNSLATVEAQTKIFKDLPEFARKTVTLDNGLEFVRHQELTKEREWMSISLTPIDQVSEEPMKTPMDSCDDICQRKLALEDSRREILTTLWQRSTTDQGSVWDTPNLPNYLSAILTKGVRWCNSI